MFERVIKLRPGMGILFFITGMFSRIFTHPVGWDAFKAAARLLGAVRRSWLGPASPSFSRTESSRLEKFQQRVISIIAVQPLALATSRIPIP